MSYLNWPNRISIARAVLVAPMVICLLNLNDGPHWVRHAALGLMLLMGASDVLDGYLARRLAQQTDLGRFLDPLADKLLTTAGVILLALHDSGVPGFVLPNWVPVLVIGKDILVVIGFALVYLSTGKYFVQPRPAGKGCTLALLAMMLGVLLAPDLPADFQAIVPGLWWLAAVMAVFAAVDYMAVGIRFAGRHQSSGGNA